MNNNHPCLWLMVLALGLLNGPYTSGLRLTGEFDPSTDFFVFLAKFGFQKTEVLNKIDSQGFIYGNITYKLPSLSLNKSNLNVSISRGA